MYIEYNPLSPTAKRVEFSDDGTLIFRAPKGDSIPPRERRIVNLQFELKIPDNYHLIIMSEKTIASQLGIIVVDNILNELEPFKITLMNASAGRYTFKEGQILCRGIVVPKTVIKIIGE